MPEHGARLHGVGHDAVVDDVEANHPLGPGKGRLDRRPIPLLPIKGEVAGGLVVDAGGAGRQRLGGVGDGGQVFIVDGNQFGGVLGQFHALRDHHGDVVADEADALAGQDGAQRHVRVGALAVGDADDTGQVAEAVGHRIGAGVDGEHAGRRRRLGHIDGAEAGMGVGAAHDDRKRLAVHRDVGHKAPRSLQQPGVLGASVRLTDGELVHGLVLSCMVNVLKLLN